MNVQTLNPSGIRKQGLKVLAKELGPLGMARFIQQYETGSGDYTAERGLWLSGNDVKDIVREIKKQQK